VANRSVELAVRMSVDASNVAAEFGSVGDAAKRMGDDIDTATSTADTSTKRLDGVADAADNTASASSQAAGGIGDLAGALEATGVVSEGTAAAMETGAAAIMGVTGAADILNLVTGSTIVMKIRERVATVASTVATKAATVATKAQTVAQKALNIAMKANPIGLIITAVALLVAGFVLLYRKSETFRNIVGVLKDKVTDAFSAMLKPIGWVIDKVKKVIDWIGDAIQKTKAALGLGKEYGSTMGRILGTVMDDLAEIGDRIRDNYDAQNSGGGGASGGGVGNPRMGFGIQPKTGETTIDARVQVTVEAGATADADLVRRLEDLQRRQAVRLGRMVPGAKVVTT
jgi:hypothetical protein